METKQFYEDIEDLYWREQREDGMPDMVRQLIQENRALKLQNMKLETVIIFQKSVISDLKDMK